MIRPPNICPNCDGDGLISTGGRGVQSCERCDGLGFIEEPDPLTNQDRFGCLGVALFVIGSWAAMYLVWRSFFA